MKETELRQHATCSVCNQGIGRAKVPLFWVVTIQRHGLKLREIQSQDGTQTRS